MHLLTHIPVGLQMSFCGLGQADYVQDLEWGVQRAWSASLNPVENGPFAKATKHKSRPGPGFDSGGTHPRLTRARLTPGAEGGVDFLLHLDGCGASIGAERPGCACVY